MVVIATILRMRVETVSVLFTDVFTDTALTLKKIPGIH